MTVFRHRDFDKEIKRLRVNEQKKLKQRLNLFRIDPNNLTLNNHALKGKGGSYFSINITGDLRAIYKPLGEDAVLFLTVDTHRNLYS